MAERIFVCTSSEPFDLFGLREATQRELSAQGGEAVDVRGTHPDREADGSCRWCGCRDDEVVSVRIR
ncbi:MAG: hypothetical protein WD557_15580 [Dehalococcoidia bacterium]